MLCLGRGLFVLGGFSVCLGLFVGFLFLGCLKVLLALWFTGFIMFCGRLPAYPFRLGRLFVVYSRRILARFGNIRGAFGFCRFYILFVGWLLLLARFVQGVYLQAAL